MPIHTPRPCVKLSQNDDYQREIAHPAHLTKGCAAYHTMRVDFNPLTYNHSVVTRQAFDARTEAGDTGVCTSVPRTDHSQSAYNALDLLEAAGRYSRAVRQTFAPGDAESTTARGIGCMQRGDLARAVMLLRKALACESYYIPARYLLGVAHLMQGRYGEAVTAFEVTVALAPQHARAVIGLGIAYIRAGQAERAREAFASVRRRWPDCPELLLALARAYRAGGLRCEALDCIARVLGLAITGEDLAWRARRLLTAIEYEA